MNDTVRDILAILEHGKPELQVAAVQILGELKPKGAEVGKALEAALERGGDRVLGRYLLEALAKLGTADAVRAVARSLQGPEGMGDQAAHLLAEMGKSAHRALAEQFDTASVEARTRMLQIVGREPTREGLQILEKALFQHELAELAASTLAETAEQLTAEQQKQLSATLANELTERNGTLSEVCMTAALRALGRVDPGGSRAFLVKLAGDKSSTEVRVAALRALRGVQLTAAQVKTFLAILQDGSQKELHAAVRETLEGLEEWPAALASALKKMIAARSPEQRLFALRALRGFPTPEVARIALKFLGHADESYRAAAAQALARNKSAVEPLLRALQTERNPDRAMVLIGILVRLREHFQPRHLRTVVERAIKQMGSNAAVGERLLDAALAIDADKAMPMLLEKAVRLRRVKRFEEAAVILARLCVPPHGHAEALYQLALARLLLDQKRPAGTVAANGGSGSATMGYFAHLVRDGFPLLDRIKKETMLGPDVMLRLAKHFVEGVGAERKFGLDLLQHLASRTRGKIGEEAKLSLRTAGM